MFKLTAALALASYTLAVPTTPNTCPNVGLGTFACPKAGWATCGTVPSLSSNIIFRCADSANGLCAQSGNCNDNLAGVPPAGVKVGAKCYEDYPLAGNGQCVYNCVLATRLDGSQFYPLGCTSASSAVPTSSSSMVVVSSSSSAVPTTTVSASSSGPVTVSSSSWYSVPTTTSCDTTTETKTKTWTKTSTWTESGNTKTSVYTECETDTTTYTKTATGTEYQTTGTATAITTTYATPTSPVTVVITSSTSYVTTTLPNGSVSTGTTAVAVTQSATQSSSNPGYTGPQSNDAMGREFQNVFALAVAGLLALL